MRRAFFTLSATVLVLAFSVPVLAGPPIVSCTFLSCCRAPCGTWCVDMNGGYQDCETFVGACDGACDLQLKSLSEVTPLTAPQPAAEGETPANLFAPATEPMQSRVPDSGACATGAA